MSLSNFREVKESLRLAKACQIDFEWLAWPIKTLLLGLEPSAQLLEEILDNFSDEQDSMLILSFIFEVFPPTLIDNELIRIATLVYEYLDKEMLEKGQVMHAFLGCVTACSKADPKKHKVLDKLWKKYRNNSATIMQQDFLR